MPAPRLASAFLALFVYAACGAPLETAGPEPKQVTQALPEGGTGPLQVRIEEVGSLGDTFAEDESRLVAADIAKHSSGKHGKLPPIQKSAEGRPDAWPKVEIFNDTPHRLVVLFAGPCSRAVALKPNAAYAVECCEGEYDIAAELSAPNFLPFVGEDEVLENGYSYSVKFYVMRPAR